MSTRALVLTRPPRAAILPADVGTPKDKGEAMRRAILRELQRREALNMPSPTWEELGEVVGIVHTTVLYHAKIMRRAGQVTFTDGRTRTIRTAPKAADID